MSISLKNKGKCVIFSAPSGAGKTTIVHHLLKQNIGLEFSVSACSTSFALFVQPPSYEELEKRLRGRSTETEEKINQRMEKARKELAFASEFDTVLINDNLEDACNKAKSLVTDFLTQ